MSEERGLAISGRGEKHRSHESGAVADRGPRVGVRLPDDLLDQVSGCLEKGHLLINVIWKKSK